jgi:hypothetical protein
MVGPVVVLMVVLMVVPVVVLVVVPEVVQQLSWAVVVVVGSLQERLLVHPSCSLPARP